MSFESFSVEEEQQTETIFVAEEYVSSEEPPMSEWSSLDIEIPEDNEKRILFKEGKYHPGSGNVCTKYIPMSDSTVFHHVYYNYPAVTDPGILDALLRFQRPICYPDDGQEKYLAECEEISQCPVKSFHRNLTKEDINLKYYCVDPKGVRAMASALRYNDTVKTLNLTDNFLNDEACYHLGEMLSDNRTLEQLNLSGCRIKASGVQRLLIGLDANRTLTTLNLNRNQLADDGAEQVAKSVFEGLSVKNLYLNYNNICGKGISALAKAFETHCKLVVLDLSWNSLTAPGPTYDLLTILGESNIQELNLSWNSLSGPKVGLAIKNLLKAKYLTKLNLSNNELANDAIPLIVSGLIKAKELVTIDLSYNPMSPSDALKVIIKMKAPAVKVQNILMEDVFVTDEFLEALTQVKDMEGRENFNITYGELVSTFIPTEPDMRDLVLKRAHYLAMRRKKRPIDIALVILQITKLAKDNIMTIREFYTAIRASGAHLDNSLIEEMCNAFAGSKGKNKTIDLTLLADYVKRKWPEKKLPPTPPPEPQVVVIKSAAKKKKIKKGKGKKK